MENIKTFLRLCQKKLIFMVSLYILSILIFVGNNIQSQDWDVLFFVIKIIKFFNHESYGALSCVAKAVSV